MGCQSHVTSCLQIMAVLNFHYKLYKKETALVLDVWQTVAHCGRSLLHWFGLQPVVFPDEDNTLPAVSTSDARMRLERCCCVMTSVLVYIHVHM